MTNDIIITIVIIVVFIVIYMQIARQPGRRQTQTSLLVDNCVDEEEDVESKRLAKLKHLRDDWERSTNRKIQAKEIRRQVQSMLAENEMALEARRARCLQNRIYGRL